VRAPTLPWRRAAGADEFSLSHRRIVAAALPRPRRGGIGRPRSSRASAADQNRTVDGCTDRRSSGGLHVRAAARLRMTDHSPCGVSHAVHGRCPRKCPAARLVGSPSSARHGCTASASRDITTLSVRRLPHAVQRKGRSFSSSSPLPTSMIACRLAGACGTLCTKPARTASQPRGEWGRSGGHQVTLCEQPRRAILAKQLVGLFAIDPARQQV
jgi:hypothetical protein